MHISLGKMHSHLDGSSVHYQLNDLQLNDLIGQQLQFQFKGEIHCIACQRLIKKTYQQGFCYPCFKRLARCDRCMVSPETCHYDQGSCREPEWGEQHCLQAHRVYLANTSGLKVGISRNIPSRWIDQGATQALAIAEVSNRLQSGLLECIFKTVVADKTQWRKMLQGNSPELDLVATRDALFAQLDDQIQTLQQQHPEQIHLLTTENVATLTYPVRNYPKKITSLNFDKTPEISGELVGIKGQYLILDTGVLNMRKFSGYAVELQLSA